jgi:hypothetical protein
VEVQGYLLYQEKQAKVNKIQSKQQIAVQSYQNNLKTFPQYKNNRKKYLQK